MPFAIAALLWFLYGIGVLENGEVFDESNWVMIGASFFALGFWWDRFFGIVNKAIVKFKDRP